MLCKSSRLILLASVLLFTLAILNLTNASTTPVTDDDGESTAKKIAKTTNPLCLSNEKQSAMTMVALFILLFIALMFVYLIMRLNIHWFPDSIGVVIISAIIGGVFRLVIPQYLNIIAQLDAGIFFIVFLPVIIFDAGYSLDKGDFFGNLGSIILYAFIGTVNSVICIAAGVYFSGYMGWSIEVPWIECFMYGSLVSAIDTVATLAIFNALKVNSTLHSLVFGESIVNDAVVVALFETFEKFSNATANTNTTTLILQGVGQFTLASAGSVIVGIGFALFAAAFFRFIDVRKYRTLEIALFFVFAYLPYVATFPFLSGIMTVMTVGIVMSYYLTPNLSKEGAQSISDLSHSMSFVCETLVFVYMGMAVFAFDGVWEKFDWVLTLVIIITCLLGRALNTFPITALVNLYRRNKISYRNQFIMWFSGGLRGAMAFALAVGWKRHNALADYFFTSTLIVAVFTIVVFGGLTYPFIRLFRVETKGHGGESHSQPADQKPENAKDAQTYWANILKERKEHRNLITALDEKIMRKIFIRPDALQTINLTVASHNDYEDSAANEQELQDTTPEVANREFDRLYESLTKNPSKLALYQRIIKKIEENQGDSTSSPSETAIAIN